MGETAADCLIVTNQFPPMIGGAAGVYAGLARAASGRIVILCASRDYRTREEVPDWLAHDRAAEYPIHRIPQVRPDLRDRRIRSDLAIRWRMLRIIWWLRRRYGFPAVCLADDETTGWLIQPLHAMNCRVLLYTHGDDLKAQPGQDRLRTRRARQFARADRIVAVSSAGADELCRGFGVNPRLVTVLPNGVDLDHFRPMPVDEMLREKLGLSGRRVIITVARLLARKGIDRIIQALPAIAAQVPEAHYLVAGDGPQLAELQGLARELGVAARVTFLGAVPRAEIPAYLALAEVFAMPNRRLANGQEDGFPLVFLEANACGLPVIGGRAGGVPEVLEHETNGLLVDGESVPAIADAVIRLLTDQPLARRLAAEGRERALQAGWASRAQAFLRLCNGAGEQVI